MQKNFVIEQVFGTRFAFSYLARIRQANSQLDRKNHVWPKNRDQNDWNLSIVSVPLDDIRFTIPFGSSIFDRNRPERRSKRPC